MNNSAYVFLLCVASYGGVLYWAWKKGKDGLYR